jgi:predicted CoA-binding protein
MEKVIVLGASPKEDRYANKAVKRLLQNGYEVIPVNPAYDVIEGIHSKKQLKDCPNNAHSLTLYLRPELLEKHKEEILQIRPQRVIFNPGTESAELQTYLEENGIPTLQACTLVLLGTNQF